MKDTINAYLKRLEAGEFTDLLDLFHPDAVVVSPLYGERPAADFYRELFEDTDHSILTPLRIFTDPANRSGAAYFLYEWVMNNGRHVSFPVVDLFDFDEAGRILQLTIIYDTALTRAAFAEQRGGG